MAFCPLMRRRRSASFNNHQARPAAPMTAPVTRVVNVPEPLSWFCTMAETTGLKNYFSI
jgi:hypothetical protein